MTTLYVCAPLAPLLCQARLFFRLRLRLPLLVLILLDDILRMLLIDPFHLRRALRLVRLRLGLPELQILGQLLARLVEEPHGLAIRALLALFRRGRFHPTSCDRFIDDRVHACC